jgi:hypothetical protein
MYGLLCLSIIRPRGGATRCPRSTSKPSSARAATSGIRSAMACRSTSEAPRRFGLLPGTKALRLEASAVARDGVVQRPATAPLTNRSKSPLSRLNARPISNPTSDAPPSIWAPVRRRRPTFSMSMSEPIWPTRPRSDAPTGPELYWASLIDSGLSIRTEYRCP